MPEIADILVNVDDEDHLIVGTKRRVETFYDFFENKNS